MAPYGGCMPTCLECGFVSSRLQWTHFKYKCTNRFANGREYQKEYPGAPLVDDDLKKRTRVTERGMILKYGEDEGRLRWAEYCAKQSRSNTFEYKRDRYGWTKDQFDAFNKTRASTLENMIARHGEVHGLLKWEVYCERQAYTKSLNYFVERYGAEVGSQRYSEINQLKIFNIDNIQRVHKCSYDVARDIIESRNVSPLYTSELEKEIVCELEIKLGTSIDYSINSKQYCVYGNSKPNFYDIVHNRRAIEIYGDYWHCNPAKYDSNFYHPHMQSLAKDVWARDFQKIQLIEVERKIPVLVVWENEYRNNKEGVLEACIQWIRSENL